MISATTGWGMDVSHVLRSTDGGSTWADVTPGNAPSGARFEDGFFLDGSTAWVPYTADTAGGGAAAGIMATTDGGARWGALALAPRMGGTGLQLDFISPQGGWMLVDVDSNMAVESAALYSTTDGGAHWTEVAAVGPSTGSAPGAMPYIGFKTITFVNQEIGFLTSSSGILGFSDGIYLDRTDDGGHTWQRVTMPPPPGYSADRYEMQATSVRFFGPDDGVMGVWGGSTQTTIHSSALTVYTTDDQGESWRPSQPFFPSDAPVAPTFVSPAIGFTFVGGKQFVTRDAGGTWDPTNFGLPVSPSFVTPQIAFGWSTTSSPPILWRTVDGGEHWTSTVSLARPPGAVDIHQPLAEPGMRSAIHAVRAPPAHAQPARA